MTTKDNAPDLVREEESAQPLYDQVRQDILDSYRLAARSNAILRANYKIHLVREMREECDFRTQIFFLYHYLRPKIIKEIFKSHKEGKPSKYSPLVKLDISTAEPRLSELFLYFDLLRDYIEELKITRIENRQLVYDKNAALMEGFGQESHAWTKGAKRK